MISRAPYTPTCLALSALLLVLVGAPATGSAAADRPDPEEVRRHLMEQHRTQGDIYYNSGVYYSAFDKYRRLVEAGGGTPEILYRLGYSALQLRQREKSEEWFRRAEEAFEARVSGPDATLGDFYYLAASRSYQGDDEGMRAAAEEAVERFGPAAKAGTLSGEDIFRLARLHGFLRQTAKSEQMLDKAVEAYRRQEEIDRDDQAYPMVMLSRARKAMAAGQHEKAVRLYEELLERRRRVAEAPWELGLARLRAGDGPGAQEAWDAAKSLDPAHGTEAGYAANLMQRVVTYTRAYPGAEPVEVEAPYAQMDRRALEAAIAGKVADVRQAHRDLGQGSAAGGPPALGPVATSADQERLERAEAELAAALLAYTLRDLPIREVANAHGLVGWIFAPGRGQ